MIWQTLANDECVRCIFHRGGACLFERRRPWNMKQCPDFKPFCLACCHPDWMCHTCGNTRLRRVKPSRMRDAGFVRKPVERAPYECVWQVSA